ncbi:hypothetical protein A3B42_04820 [Candidatus Daviesbacteria bacterium RIFCSPLOWO2_01_FULL_38_10]|uniref:IrrE N-terminal-like domain-containing protein n=1 Tax=Candidatus Daviesbacteria bacterium GW2011_GWF2_38_6 TaxID=1618432 RepID=A0A0G0MXF6_9BACT|nr:MAG: hypothetical protein US99_C0024G0006 [Candidatus Daviesbacteria bacterium GW2011_GWF2_38_6]OGE27615.1 MAG: hypothetical protein A2772_00150 [Candidatus Daviesbacteria bacterium RIFCSPHIGHO2_01_FULL_38_8b]OGE39795.1 MAG: hypothetical protein A3B42_04820 [Candidatus Daviesbacteria bacterium RIFCSPLOWO2_01_FULL_38_10]OGE68677.1 MAG: hypothetical protein A3H81_00285 [Candidatus Daviesbacteria bacterium RIFCSPLOWO2_02_FULL_38_18]OGE72966.1 MAG: hypothetical protein A3H18_00165 [Candidatus Da
MNITLQCLSYKRIGEIADQFLTNYHPRNSLPIPIEEIAEQKLNLKIHEQINLKKDYDVDGFLISDLTTIFIDFNLYMNFENRTRFTIAHEIGHFILHGDLFKNLNINSVEDLNSLAAKITDEEHGWLEYQAYSFASHVLVPTQLLINELKKRLGRIPSQETPEIFATITEDLLDIFQVSGDVLARRLVKEGIVKSNS